MKITKDMTIDTVLKTVPNAKLLLMNYGLHCVGCHGSVYETLEMGTSVHGIVDEELEQLVDNLNDHYTSYLEGMKTHDFFITVDAYQAIKTQGGKVKVEILKGDMPQALLQAEILKDEKIIKDYEALKYDEIKVYIKPDVKKEIKKAEIEYIVNDFNEGFVVSKLLTDNKE